MRVLSPSPMQSPPAMVVAEGLAATGRRHVPRKCACPSEDSLKNHSFPIETGAAPISLPKPPTVNSAGAILNALPVVAVSLVHRRFALVCLNAKLTPICASMRCLHRRSTRTGQIASVCEALDEVARWSAPSTLVIEQPCHGARSIDLARSGVIDWAEDHRLRVVSLSRPEACREVCGSVSLHDAAAHIAHRYERLAEEFVDAEGNFRPMIKDWNAMRSLVVAHVLAHAFAARSVVKAFGRIPPHPFPRTYDPRSS